LAEVIREVWREKVPVEGEEKDLATILQEKLEVRAAQKGEETNRDVLPRLREFIPGLQRIALDIRHQEYDLSKSVGVGVRFEDVTGSEVPVGKKGDGTKRRVTLALLRHRVERDCIGRGSVERGSNNLFFFDEPNTHLHVRAQRELVEILEQMAESNQVVITTHSPFILML